jgi:hypothetical protein
MVVEAGLNNTTYDEWCARHRTGPLRGSEVYLLPYPIVVIHHQDEDPGNDSPDNLEVKTRATHTSDHWRYRPKTSCQRSRIREGVSAYLLNQTPEQRQEFLRLTEEGKRRSRQLQ